MTLVLTRAAETSDLEALTVLCAEVHALHVAAHPERFRTLDAEAIRRSLADRLANPQQRVLVALRGEIVVGYVVLVVREFAAHAFGIARRVIDLEQIAVATDEQGKGVGDVLVAAARDFARERQIPEIELTVWAFNERARRFFSRHGFVAAYERRITSVG